ncbi:MAG: AraC family transcriptional regulator [bacterium]|nr:AraC family transcriptional regulator [bacterium]
MLIREFPDINWIRKQSRNDFADGIASNGRQLVSKGWPTVVLNTKSFGTERNGIISPFSVFLNLKGTSQIRVDNKIVTLDENSFCLVNPGQSYDLIIPEKPESTEVFNLHFGNEFYNQAIRVLSHSTSSLLDNPNLKLESNELPIRSFWKEDAILKKIDLLKSKYSQGIEDPTEDDILFDIFELTYQESQKGINAIESIKSMKVTTRKEIISRLLVALDFMHSNFTKEVSIDDIANVAMLSKFHFLRTFKEAFGQTPHQYLTKIRLQKSKELLKQTSWSISEISTYLGYQQPNSFTRLFSKTFEVSPVAFRN